MEAISKAVRTRKPTPQKEGDKWSGLFISGKEAVEKAAKSWKHRRSRHELAYTVSR